jgi:DNA (cytosine-5)-methyltransferase 1
VKYLSLFSGIEACSVAWKPLGWDCVAVSEIEKFPCEVLNYHYPNVPNLGDVTKITEDQIKNLGQINIVVGGSPCQDLSLAGKRKGFTNADGTVTRSGLFYTQYNIFKWAQKHCGARFLLWENVPGAFSSSKGRDFASVVELMAGLDDLEVPKNGWGGGRRCVGGQWFARMGHS